MSPQFRLRHPTEPHVVATYGWNEEGSFAVVREEPHDLGDYAMPGLVRGRYHVGDPEYDSLEPVLGLLEFLANEGFFDL